MTALGNLNVSRETLERLEIYAAELKKWNPKINLVAKSTIVEIWNRHFADSAQLLELAPPATTKWADFGSGGGFPGLVVAILLAEEQKKVSVSLVESDLRKSAFLRHVIRETDAPAEVLSNRIEACDPFEATVVSARALADLSTLLGLSERHLATDGVMLFPKGKDWQLELSDAQTKWRFDYEIAKSKTNDQSVILRISGVSRA